MLKDYFDYNDFQWMPIKDVMEQIEIFKPRFKEIAKRQEEEKLKAELEQKRQSRRQQVQQQRKQRRSG